MTDSGKKPSKANRKEVTDPHLNVIIPHHRKREEDTNAQASTQIFLPTKLFDEIKLTVTKTLP